MGLCGEDETRHMITFKCETWSVCVCVRVCGIELRLQEAKVSATF